MKILHVVPNPFYLSRGGLLRVAEQISMAQGLGLECRVVCYHLGKPFGDVPIHRIVRIPWYRKTVPGATFHRIYLDLLLAVKCFSVGREYRPDIIHAHLHEGVFAALPYARRYGTPLLLDAEGSLTGELRSYGFPLLLPFGRIEHFLNNAPDMVAASSQSLLDILLPVPEKFRRRPMVLRDSIDTDLFSPRQPDHALKSRLGIEPDSPVVVYLGSLDRLQGIDLLADVAKRIESRIPQMRFLIMGGPGESSWKKSFFEADVRNCIFTGAIEREEAPRYLSLGTVAVSLKRADSFQANGKLLDYMAMGIAVVAFDTPANREILGENGCLSPEGDTIHLAARLESLYFSHALRRKLGDALRKRAVETFSRGVRAAQLMRLYGEMAPLGDNKFASVGTASRCEQETAEALNRAATGGLNP